MIAVRTTDGEWHIFPDGEDVVGEWDTMLTVYGRNAAALASFAKTSVDRWLRQDPRAVTRSVA